MNVLVTEGLTKTYDGRHPVVDQCSFTLEQGRICALLGASGSGKSTILRLLAGLERTDAGTITIADVCVSSDAKIVTPQQRQVGMVFQNYALFPHLTVQQNVKFGLREKNEKRISELLELVQLGAYAERYPHQLSGGQQQRVALARALSTRPALLLLDEPFSNLDTHLKMDLRRAVAAVVRQLDQTLLFVTHDIVDALDIADEIIYLEEGKILFKGSVASLLQADLPPSLMAEIQHMRENASVLNSRLKGA